MRRNGKVNFGEQGRKKEIARRYYAFRQIDRYIKWTTEVRGFLKWRDLKYQYNKYNIEF